MRNSNRRKEALMRAITSKADGLIDLMRRAEKAIDGPWASFSVVQRRRRKKNGLDDLDALHNAGGGG